MIRVAHISTVDLTLRFLLLPELSRLREEGFDVTGISAPGPWVERVEAAGIRHIPWPHATRAWNPRADVQAFRELLAILRRERFDLVHTHTPKAAFLGRVAARRTGVPCVVNTVHGFYVQPGDRPAKKLAVLGAERIAASCSDLELYQSEEDLDWARRLRIGESARRVHIGGGIDLAEFDPGRVGPERRAELRRELGIPEDAVVVGTVSRLVAEKGVRELLEAASALGSDDVRFLVVGPAEPEKPDAIGADEIARATAGGGVFTGAREDIRDLYAVMDVFVLASWREGLPGSAIEALAMGKPLVLTDIRGCREVARDGVEALVVPPRDAVRLTEAIRRLVDDPALRSRLGAASRARAVEQFDRLKMLDLIAAEYRRLLARKGLVPAPDDSVRTRTASAADLPEIARLHRESLPAAFMSRLGERFLRRFYRALLDDDSSLVLVADQGGAVTGFAAATASMRAFSRRFYLRHGVPAALAAGRVLLRSGIPRGVLETAKYASRSDGLPDAEFISIGVARPSRRTGAGRLVALETLAWLEALGVKQVTFFTSTSNDAVSAFLRELGFRPSTLINVHRGVPGTVWITDLPS